MDKRFCRINLVSSIHLLQSCIKNKSLPKGKHVHGIFLRSHVKHIILENILINLYGRFGGLGSAEDVFNKMSIRDDVSWNSIISSYIRHGYLKEALNLYAEMQEQGFEPNKVTFISVSKACADLQLLAEGKWLHVNVLTTIFKSDVVLNSALAHMYAKCGSIEELWQVFHKMPLRDIVAWNVILTGYVQHGKHDEVLKLYRQNHQERIQPDEVTSICVLNSSAVKGAVQWGKWMHAITLKSYYQSDIFVGSTLVDMYSKCESINDARNVFERLAARDVVCWNAMITGYVQIGNSNEAIKLFEKMHLEGVQANEGVYVSVLSACCIKIAFGQGKVFHAGILKSGCIKDAVVGGALTDMYVKCGNLEDVYQVFDRLNIRNVYTWTTIIAGHVDYGYNKESLSIFKFMLQECVEPNDVSFTSILSACAELAAMTYAKFIYAGILRSRCQSDIFVGSTLADMYAKCGSIKYASELFDSIPVHDVVSWNAIISGYAQHGDGKAVLDLFKSMLDEGVKPNNATFVSVLFGCGHSSLIDDSCYLYCTMVQNYGITPVIEHYACMVDLFGRAGHLDEAEDYISKMLSEPSPVIWTSFLNACILHGDMEAAQHATEHLLTLEPENTAAFVLLSNIYASNGNATIYAAKNNCYTSSEKVWAI